MLMFLKVSSTSIFGHLHFWASISLVHIVVILPCWYSVQCCS